MDMGDPAPPGQGPGEAAGSSTSWVERIDDLVDNSFVGRHFKVTEGHQEVLTLEEADP